MYKHNRNLVLPEGVPEGAMYVREDGLTIIDPVKAKGCKAIVDNCKDGTIFWNEELQLPQIYTLDAHRLDEGEKLPRCVESCPTQAMHWGDLNDPESDVSKFIAAHPGETDAFRYVPAASLRTMTDGTSPALFAAAAGESLHRWYDSQNFCGRCGARMEKSTAERAMVCPQCRNTVYPKICPAVIAAVHDGDRLLLTRYRGRPFKKYALIAGFNEIGESIEDTVHREVMEEAGLRVKNLRFYKSQPWVFTDTLLMGFVCELDGSDKITVQESELAEANWHLRSELPEDHSHISLTGEMIEQFRRGAL